VKTARDKARKVVHAAAVVAAIAFPAFDAPAAEYSCAKDSHLVGACFTLHGRLEKMANSRIKLWHIGTKRIFGVQYPGDMPEVGGQFVELPANIRDNWDDTSEYLFGDFRVCPFSKPEPGSNNLSALIRLRTS
jgi:hypothetical protein